MKCLTASLLAVAVVLPAMATDYNLCGQRAYSTDADDTYGIFTFTTQSTTSAMIQVKPLDADPVGGGVMVQDRYYCFSVEPGDWSNNYYMYIFDADNDFDLVTRVGCTSSFITEGQLPAYNAAEGIIYVAYEKNASTQTLARLDVSRRQRTDVAPLDTRLVALTADNVGNLYGISTTGYLYRIDSANGEMHYVGYTGVSPDDYSQSACVSPDGSTIYWSAFSGGRGSLYAVRTASGSATKIKSFTHDELFVSLWIDSEVVLPGAPAAASELGVGFVQGSLTGTFSCTAPQTTANGSPLDGDLYYTLTVDGSSVVSSMAGAGQPVSETVSVANNGLHEFSITFSNNSGNGVPARLKNVYVGKDTPSMPRNVTLTPGSAPGQMLLTWDAPLDGVHGGYVNPGEVKYRVRRMPDDVMISDDATSPMTDYYLPETPTRVFYEVIPYVDDLTGIGAQSGKVLTGTALSVPFSEDFSTNSGALAFAVEDANDDGHSWEWQYDYGYYRIYDNNMPKDDWIFTPMLRFAPNVEYTLTYDIRSLAKENMRICLGTDAASTAMTGIIADTREVDTDYDWEHCTHTFTVEADGNYFIGWHANTADPSQALALYLDNVSITGVATIVAPVEEQAIEVRVSGRRVLVSSSSPVPVVIAAADGKVVYDATTCEASAKLEAGIYIVRCGNHIRKLMIR